MITASVMKRLMMYEFFFYHELVYGTNQVLSYETCALNSFCQWLLKFTTPLILSWRRPLSYRNQSIDLRSKWMDWFLYDNSLRQERVNPFYSTDVFLYLLKTSENNFFATPQKVSWRPLEATQGNVCQMFSAIIKRHQWNKMG